PVARSPANSGPEHRAAALRPHNAALAGDTSTRWSSNNPRRDRAPANNRPACGRSGSPDDNAGPRPNRRHGHRDGRPASCRCRGDDPPRASGCLEVGPGRNPDAVPGFEPPHAAAVGAAAVVVAADYCRAGRAHRPVTLALLATREATGGRRLYRAPAHPQPPASTGVQPGDRDRRRLPAQGGRAGHGPLSEIPPRPPDPYRWGDQRALELCAEPGTGEHRTAAGSFARLTRVWQGVVHGSGSVRRMD
nr:hypothetical protein [Tanacetum cinerariifolium]